MISYVKDCLHEYKAIRRQRKSFKVISKYIDSRENVFYLEREAIGDVVWQFWESPKVKSRAGNELVVGCLESIEQCLWEGFERKLLTLKSSLKYIQFPEFVYDKLQRGAPGFGLAAFSDILRLALLCKYGGIWVDATILALRPLGNIYLCNGDGAGFSFGRSNLEPFQVRKEWRRYDSCYFSWSMFSRVKWLNSFIVAGEKRDVLYEVLRILLLIWKCEDRYPHYFTTQIVYEVLTRERGLEGFMMKSDVPVHYLQRCLNEMYDERVADEIEDKYPLQKMNWKIRDSEIVVGDTFFNRFFGAQRC